MSKEDETIILTRKAGSKEWSAVCPEYPEHVTSGYTSVEALRQYNMMLWRKHYEKQNRLDKCHRLMRDAVRRRAGIPEWALGFPSWLLWNKMEREHHRLRMDKIVIRLCAAKNLQDLSYEELTKLILAEFDGLILDAPVKPLDPDVVEILSR